MTKSFLSQHFYLDMKRHCVKLWFYIGFMPFCFLFGFIHSTVVHEKRWYCISWLLSVQIWTLTFLTCFFFHLLVDIESSFFDFFFSWRRFILPRQKAFILSKRSVRPSRGFRGHSPWRSFLTRNCRRLEWRRRVTSMAEAWRMEPPLVPSTGEILPFTPATATPFQVVAWCLCRFPYFAHTPEYSVSCFLSEFRIADVLISLSAFEFRIADRIFFIICIWVPDCRQNFFHYLHMSSGLQMQCENWNICISCPF